MPRCLRLKSQQNSRVKVKFQEWRAHWQVGLRDQEKENPWESTELGKHEEALAPRTVEQYLDTEHEFASRFFEMFRERIDQVEKERTPSFLSQCERCASIHRRTGAGEVSLSIRSHVACVSSHRKTKD